MYTLFRNLGSRQNYFPDEFHKIQSRYIRFPAAEDLEVSEFFPLENFEENEELSENLVKFWRNGKKNQKKIRLLSTFKEGPSIRSFNSKIFFPRPFVIPSQIGISVNFKYKPIYGQQNRIITSLSRKNLLCVKLCDFHFTA